jgi:hypothetical protein
MRSITVSIAAFLLAISASASGKDTIERSDNLAVDVAHDGRMAIDVGGEIWTVPRGGGQAVQLTRGLGTAARPRWSPNATSIAFQAVSDGTTRIYLYDMESGSWQVLGRDGGADLQPSWHPGGRRIVYASEKSGSGLDLWEVDLATGLHWRLSSHSGDESEPSWSADGRDLVYVHHEAARWSLVLRRHGEPEERLVTTTDKISAPSWRPDGSLILFHRQSATETRLEMVILSEPRLSRSYANGEQFHPSPVSWRDRKHMVYAANGTIRVRSFDNWSSRRLPFQATVGNRPTTPTVPERRQLPAIDEPTGTLIVHADRLFDGVVAEYHRNIDVVIKQGRIVSVEAHAERPGTIVIDLGDLAVMPGFIDAAAALPGTLEVGDGARLLATGVTTIVGRTSGTEQLNATWSGKRSPGPRLLSADKWPVKPAAAITDSQTPGLDVVLESRQARSLGTVKTPPRRFPEPPGRDVDPGSLVLGSRDNGLPAGLALHAEFIARTAGGLQPAQVLRAAGVNSAAALGADPYIGRIGVGAVADMVFVDGDPLSDISDALKIVAVVRNGRFFSVASLLERTATGKNVE